MTCRNAKYLILATSMLIGAAGTARADNHDVLRDMEGQIVHSSNGNCVRTRWPAAQDPCAPQTVTQQTVVQTQTVSAASLTQEQRTVYFNFNRSVLTPEAKSRLDTLATVLKGDANVKEARVVGTADRIGSVAYNDKLSQKRAETVRDYLIAQGYTNARVTETRWVGKSEPITNCPGNKVNSKLISCLQNDRRVEVEIVFIDNGQNADPQQ
ncbi:MAG: OmpA family protein [Alphaproteobacteria bacterium]